MIGIAAAAAPILLSVGAMPGNPSPPQIVITPAESPGERDAEAASRLEMEARRRQGDGDLLGVFLLPEPRSHRAIICDTMAGPFSEAAAETKDPALREARLAEAADYAARSSALRREHASNLPEARQREIERKAMQLFGILSMSGGAFLSREEVENAGEDSILYLFTSKLGARCLQLAEGDEFTPPEAG